MFGMMKLFRTDVISSAPSHFMQCIPNKNKVKDEPDMSFESPVLDFRCTIAFYATVLPHAMIYHFTLGERRGND